jgi:hypothetical protein
LSESYLKHEKTVPSEQIAARVVGFSDCQFGREQKNTCLYGKAGNLWRAAASLDGEPSQI